MRWTVFTGAILYWWQMGDWGLMTKLQCGGGGGGVVKDLFFQPATTPHPLPPHHNFVISPQSPICHQWWDRQLRRLKNWLRKHHRMCTGLSRHRLLCKTKHLLRLSLWLFQRAAQRYRTNTSSTYFRGVTPRKYAFLPCGHFDFESAVNAQNDEFKGSFDVSRSLNLKTWPRNSIQSNLY